MDGFSTDPKKKLVSYDQMVALLDFLKEHPELANGKTRGRRGKLHTVRIWHQCAKKVNIIKDGAFKDGRGWAKYWCDWKYRVRRKALELRACKESNKTPPEGVSNLTSLEETLLNIIGDNAVDNIVIKNDPLADKESADEEPDHESNEDINIHYNDAAINRKSMKNLIRKRKTSSPDISDEDGSGPSSPVERKPRLSVTNGDPDLDDAREFIRIEKMRLERDEQKLKSLQCIVTQITRIADIMSSIKDVLKDSKV